MNPLELDLDGRVALVTGASRGIGAAIARTLASCGCRVALPFNRSRAEAEEVSRSIVESGAPRPHLAQAELADERQRARMHEEVAARLGAPEILVHNAGVYRRNPLDGPDAGAFLAAWRATMDVNLEAAAHLTYLALPAMRRARFGRIVMISSRAAFRGETDCPDYAVSKSGMVALARSLARAEGPNGITANTVCPGWVETEMAAKDLAERGDAIRSEIPLGRVATPRDVASAVLFYASALGSYANGTALPLNGGSFLH
jgi:NAD(P)-dependent dehydrogenase (short-subunit alcohol dehydrogenase family)